MPIQNSLTCPHCSKAVSLSEAVSHDLERALRDQIEKQFTSKEEIFKAQLQAAQKEKDEAMKAAALEKLELQKKLKAELSAEFSEKSDLEIKDLKSQLEEQKKRAKEASDKELELRKIQRELEETKKNQEQELQKKLDETLKLKEQELSKKAEQKFVLEQEDLKNQLAEEKKKSTEALQKELELRRQQRELEEKQQNMKLEIQRQLDEERKRITEDTLRQAQAESSHIIEQQNLKMLELQKALEDARRKALQGSQQTQGEALELKLEEEFSRLFPNDEFEAVPKGIRGADLIHRVRSSSGKLAGTILWEFKQTKTWSDDWLYKLKDDQRELSAEIAAIVSTTLPKEIHHMGTLENIWVTNPQLAKCLAHTLREQVLQVHQSRLMNLIPGDQKENVFRYLTGTKFKQSIEGEIETVNNLLLELQKEKKAYIKIWASREQQLNQLLSFKAGLYGDLQGILGKSLPTINHLELGEPDDGTSDVG